MGKSKNFSGQPVFSQLIKFIDKKEVKKIAEKHVAERYVKKFDTHNHLVVMLFAALEGHSSIREVILGLLANAHKLSHLGLSYLVRRSTFSEANQRRASGVFGDIYMSTYRRHAPDLADSRLSDTDMRRLYIMDSTTISLFKDILKGVGRLPKNGRRKGGIKAHTIIKASENVPCLIRYSEAVRHDHMFLDQVFNLSAGSIITFDKGYVDYARYQEFTESSIWYVTRLILLCKALHNFFKQLKNFPLKYFLGDNENAIEIQIWAAMLANLLITLVKGKINRGWAFSNMVSLLRQQLMNYIDVYGFLEDPEGSWREIVNKNKSRYQNSLFPEMEGAYF